jgi:hypothetical protein
MILSWLHFIPLQLFVAIAYLLLGNRREAHPLGWLFPTRLHAAIMNAAIIASLALYNWNHQLFCRPVPWASALLLPFCVAMVVLPLLIGRSRWAIAFLPLAGLGWFCATYLLLFAGTPYLTLLLLFSLPLGLILWLTWHLPKKGKRNVWSALSFYAWVLLSPLLLLVQLVLMVRALPTRWQRAVMTLPSAALAAGCFVIALQMWNVAQKIQTCAFDESKLPAVLHTRKEKEYAELILGAHWKYHTELCLYDGWRPPYHDPRVVVSKWLLYPSARFGPSLELEQQKVLYKTLFPDKETHFSCNCAKQERLF